MKIIKKINIFAPIMVATFLIIGVAGIFLPTSKGDKMVFTDKDSNLMGANSFPTSLNSWGSGDTISSAWGNALEGKIGVDSSSDSNSLDYQLNNTSSVDPGHKHDLATSITGLTSIANASSTFFTADNLWLDITGSTQCLQTNTNGLVSGTGSACGSGGGGSATEITVCNSAYCDYTTDGTADDVQINSALTAASSSGDVVFIKTGTYDITATIELYDNSVLMGAGTSTKLVLASSTDDEVIQNEDISGGNSNITIRDLLIDGNKNKQSSMEECISLIKGNGHHLIDNLTVRDCKGKGIYIQQADYSVVQNCNVFNTGTNGIDFYVMNYGKILNNFIDDTDAEVCILVNRNSAHNLISGNTVRNCYADGIQLRGYDTAVEYTRYNTIINNNVYNTGQQGIFSNQSYNRDNDIIGNMIVDSANNGIEITASATMQKISDNVVIHSGDTGVGEGFGIIANGTGYDNLITDNKVYNSYRGGISVTSSSTVSNNSVKDSGRNGSVSQYGINFGDGCIITGNYSIDTGTSTQKYGFQSTGRDSVIQNNYADGNTISDYNITGTNNFFATNDYLGIATTTPGMELEVGGDGIFAGSLDIYDGLDIRGEGKMLSVWTSGFPYELYGQDTTLYGSNLITATTKKSYLMVIDNDNNSSAEAFIVGMDKADPDIAGYNELFRIQENGRIGIGTSSPAYTLDVYGNGRIDGTLKIGAYTLPATDGTSNQILKTDGSGNITWQADTGGSGGGATDYLSQIGDVSTTTLADNYVIEWDASSSLWKSVENPGGGNFEYATSTATNNQTVFDLDFTYDLEDNELEVFCNGLRMTIADDYTETDSDTVTFLSGRNTGDKLIFAVNGGATAAAGSQLTEEQVEDYVGGMVIGNTETLITVTYQDADGTLDFVVDEASIDHDSLTGFIANEHLDWTIDLGATNIHANNYTDNTNDTVSASELTIDYGAFTCNGTTCTIDTPYQPLEATLTDIADGTIAENLVNTAHPWADNEVSDTLTCSNLVAGSAVVDISSETNLTAGRSLTMSADSVIADSELYHEEKCFYIEDPVAADDLKSLFHFRKAATITSMWCESDQTVNMDLQLDDDSPADVNGTDLVCDSTPADDTSLGGDTGAAAGERLDLVITSVSGTPTWVAICFDFTYND